MPADRTKSQWKVTESSLTCNQLVWTAPVAASSVYEPTAFITEVDFDDGPPPLVDAPPFPPPGEFILFPPSEEKAPSRKAPHSKKKPENHIPRPPNAFILFRSSFIKSQHVSTSVETNHSTLSKIIGMTWKNMSESERQVWHAKAKVEQEEHRRRFPKYAFRPQQTKSKGGTGEKRKVREVEPKDLTRCQKIAELLVQGKKGEELKAEIAEFDKHHVPQIVTRFEAPITESTFQRSSSAPIPDTELTIENQSFFPRSPITTPRKLRSKSAQPASPTKPQVEQIQTQPAPLKQESSFDFSSFSFDNAAPSTPVSPFPCDPLGDQNTSFPTESQFPSPLSIDTSFMPMGDWSQCSSPVTPDASIDFLTTPIGSPSYSAVDPFSQELEKTLNDLTQNFPVYQQQTLGSLCTDGYLGVGSDDFTHFVNPAAHLGQLDMDFSFMSAVPQYAF